MSSYTQFRQRIKKSLQNTKAYEIVPKLAIRTKNGEQYALLLKDVITSLSSVSL